jgi:hypothetical protein
MTNCVPYRQKPGRTLPTGKALTTYVPCSTNGKVQQMIISVKPLAPAKSFCESQNCKDQITFKFVTGCGIAGDPGDSITYCYSGATGAELANEIMCAINMSPTLNGQGQWAIDGTNMSYVGLIPGLNVGLEFEYDPTHFDVKILSNVPAGTAKTVNLEHGTVAHTPRLNIANCDAPMNLSGRPCAKQPTQDPELATAIESFAGVVVDGPYKARGQSSGMFPFYGDCNDGCAPPDTCIEILCGCCTMADFLMESWPESGVIPQTLYYRVAGAGDKTKLGLFSPVPGAGLVKFPGKFTPIERNGQYLVVQTH